MRIQRLLWTAAIVSSAACGLTAVGQAIDGSSSTSEDGGPGADGAPIDGAVPDASADAPEQCFPVPSGWSLVALGSDAGACASDASALYLENPSVDASGPCTCSCGAPDASPCSSSSSLSFAAKTTGGSCSVGGSIPPQVGQCQSGSLSWDPTVTGVSGTAVGPQTRACPATATKPQPAADASFVACPATGACIAAGSAACVVHSGVEPSCPAGFAARHVVTAAADLDDGRTCASCTCSSAATTCIDASLTLYTDTNCTMGGRTAIFDSTCRPYDGNFSPKSLKYEATPSPPGCTAASPTSAVSGTVTSKAQTTVCCVQ